MLGLFNAFALLVFRRSLDASFGKVTGRCWVAFITSQFHLMFYLTRTLPNMYSFGLSISRLTTSNLPSHLLTKCSNSCGGLPPPIVSTIPRSPKTSDPPPHHLRCRLPLRNSHSPRHVFPPSPHYRPYHSHTHHPRRHRMCHHCSHALCSRRLVLLATYPALARTRGLLLQCCPGLLFQLGNIPIPLLLHVRAAAFTSQPRLHTFNCICALPAWHLFTSS